MTVLEGRGLLQKEPAQLFEAAHPKRKKPANKTGNKTLFNLSSFCKSDT